MEAEAPTGRVIRMAGDGHYSAQFTPDEIGLCGLTGVPVACRVFTWLVAVACGFSLVVVVCLLVVVVVVLVL